MHSPGGRVVAHPDHDAVVGHHHHVADARVVAVPQRGRGLAPKIGPPTREHGINGVPDRPCAIVAALHEDVGARSGDDDLSVLQVDDRTEVDGSVLSGSRHPVVRHQDDGGRLAVGQRIDAVEQMAEGRIDLLDRLGDGRRGRAVAVARAIDRREVQGNQVRPAVGRERQPVEDCIDPFALRSPLGIRCPERRGHAADGRFRTHEQHRAGDHALRLGGHPDRFSAVPGAVLHGRVVPVVVQRGARRVVELVAD